MQSHPNVWAFIACIKNEEVVFQQQVLKTQAGAQKRKAPKTLAIQNRLDTLKERFNRDEIDRIEYLDGLSLLVASKK